MRRLAAALALLSACAPRPAGWMDPVIGVVVVARDDVPQPGPNGVAKCHVEPLPAPASCSPVAKLDAPPLAQGFFRDAFAYRGLNGELGRRVTFGDVNGDRFPDLFAVRTGVTPGLQHLYLNTAGTDGRVFREATAESGIARKADGTPNTALMVSLGDVDGDGDLDLVVGDTKTWTLRVYRNDVGQAQNWLRVRLAGKGAGGANRSGIGAIVRVTAGGKTQTQYVSGGYGHGNAQADLALTFGLGAACDVERVEVRWPDSAGTVTTYSGVLANYEVTLAEGESTPRYRR